MVKLSTKYLVQRNKVNKNFLIRKKGDSDEEFLLRITNLPLQNRFIDEITKMDHCINIKFLYLQNNLLSDLKNMENFPNLTHLYLQRNFLVKIKNLKPLKKLKKIYLGHNEIQVLEGMEDLKEVREIHLENQDLPAGNTLYFEPLTMQNLGESLEVLNISSNFLISIRGLKSLKNLKILNASNNYLSDLEDVAATILDWHCLRELNLTGNEITRWKWYRDSIILAAKNLEILDCSPIHPNTRAYVEKLTELKQMQRSKALRNSAAHDVDEGKSKESKSIKFASDTESKEIFFSFTEPLSVKPGVLLYPSWKLRFNVNSTNSNKHLPRPYWRKGWSYYENSKPKISSHSNSKTDDNSPAEYHRSL